MRTQNGHTATIHESEGGICDDRPNGRGRISSPDDNLANCHFPDGWGTRFLNIPNGPTVGTSDAIYTTALGNVLLPGEPVS